MKSLEVLTGEKAAAAIHALNDECRRRILDALRSREMPTPEIADLISNKGHDQVKPQTVRYHLKELERAGLIEQTRCVPAGDDDTHIMKKVWRATAESIFIATGKGAVPQQEGMEELDIAAVMRKLGFEPPSEDFVKETTMKYLEWDSLWRRGKELADQSLGTIPELSPAEYLVLRRLLSVVQLHNVDYARYWEVSKEVADMFRKAYLEGIGKNPDVY
ncbi:MAG: hypothetical protein C4K49_00505 [Candidatus Thorarchaeota archaeon]|nr:MAG: hypothetical protein C4K49_00505 [Candidatus Thorarchaeota archaeon]